VFEWNKKFCDSPPDVQCIFRNYNKDNLLWRADLKDGWTRGASCIVNDFYYRLAREQRYKFLDEQEGAIGFTYKDLDGWMSFAVVEGKYFRTINEFSALLPLTEEEVLAKINRGVRLSRFIHKI